MPETPAEDEDALTRLLARHHGSEDAADEDHTRVVDRATSGDGPGEDDHTRVVSRADSGDDNDDHTRVVARAGSDDDDHTRVVSRGDPDEDDHTVVVGSRSGEDDDRTRVVDHGNLSDESDKTVAVGRAQRGKEGAQAPLTLPSTGRRRRGIAPPPVAASFAPPAVEAIGPGAIEAYEPRQIAEPPLVALPSTGAAATRDHSLQLPSVRRRGKRTALLAWWGLWLSLAGALVGVGLIIWGILRLT